MPILKKSYSWKDFGEQADVLEVNDAKTSSRDVEEEVAFATLGLIDGAGVMKG